MYHIKNIEATRPRYTRTRPQNLASRPYWPGGLNIPALFHYTDVTFEHLLPPIFIVRHIACQHWKCCGKSVVGIIYQFITKKPSTNNVKPCELHSRLCAVEPLTKQQIICNICILQKTKYGLAITP